MGLSQATLDAESDRPVNIFAACLADKRIVTFQRSLLLGENHFAWRATECFIIFTRRLRNSIFMKHSQTFNHFLALEVLSIWERTVILGGPWENKAQKLQ
jgi:hypothetical protein